MISRVMNFFPLDDEANLDHYKTKFDEIEGWFFPEAQVIWDMLMRFQKSNGIEGNFAEIGVWKGKSALLGVMYLKPSEVAILVDIGPHLEETTKLIEANFKCRVESNLMRSSQFPYTAAYQKYAGTVKWFHVDGEHKGFTAYADLKIASHMLGGKGIICVDDFFNISYPQLTAAIFRFLFESPEFKLFFCGFNKGYICRTEDYEFYESHIRDNAVKTLREHGLGDLYTVFKTSYAHDSGCYSVSHRFRDKDLIGLDEDNEKIVF